MLKFKQQQAFTLITGLILLVVITVLTLSGIKTLSISERTSATTQNIEVSFQAAESGLRDGEKWVAGLSSKPTPVVACSSAPCDLWESGILPDFLSQTHTWWQTNGRSFSSSMGSGMVVSEPRYFIEEQDFIPDNLDPDTIANGIGLYYYRITARGTGQNDNANAIVQSIYVTRFN